MGIPVFFSYAHEDDAHRIELEKHLELLRRKNIISGWSDRKIEPGSNWEEEINFNLQNAKIIILLVSPDFLASEYCYETETIFALEQHEKGNAIVVPILVRPCYWEISEFKHLQVLPSGAKPVINWEDIDSAWLSITKQIHILTKSTKFQRVKEDISIPTSGVIHGKLLGIENIGFENLISQKKQNLLEGLSLRELIILFFIQYHQWYFSPLRIKNWGGKQKGFERFKDLSSSLIKNELIQLESENKVKSILSKKGNPIYKLK